MERTGKCMCGAVSYSAKDVGDVSACHCGMCRRWTGGPLLSAFVKDVTWHGEDNITVFTSSPWAERGFCNKCGSSLFYRVTAEGKHKGSMSIAMGTFDDQSGMTITKEWFIDRKPDAYTLAGERKTYTEAEVMAMFGGG